MIPQPRGQPSRLLASVAALVCVLGLLLVGGTTGAHQSLDRSQPLATLDRVTAVSSAAERQAPGPAAAVTPAVVASTWINVSASGGGGAPAPGYGQSVATDLASHATILFGGCLNDQCPSNQTWSFVNGTWTNISAVAGAPPAREDASMDYDPNMGGLLLFGGEGVGGALRNDTWLFRDDAWTNVSYVGGGPSPRYGASMAFDPDPEENGSVLYGGCVASGLSVDCFNDTWVWKGWSGWVPLSPSLTGPQVGLAAMAFDPVGDYLVLFGGCAGFLCLGLSDATWEFYSGQWWVAHPGTSPPRLAEASMVYDPTAGDLLLFGGVNASFVAQASTWSFSAGDWSLLGPSTSPSARGAFGMATDPSGKTPLLSGGASSGPNENDTWVYERPVSATLGASANASETSQPVNFTATVAGGTAPYRLSVAFDDGSVLALSGSGPTFSFSHAYLKAGSYTATVNVSDSVGVVASASATAIHLTSGPTISAGATASTGEVGIPFAFSAHLVSGGVGTISYAWRFGDGESGSGSAPAHAYATPGTFHVTVTGTDTLGGTANASFSVFVQPAVGVMIKALPTNPEAGGSVAFAAVVSGGVAPFLYSWSFGSGHPSAEPAPVEVFNRTGTYTVTVYVNDSDGGATHYSLQVTVSPVSSSSSSFATPPVWFWGGVAGLAVAAGAGSVLLMRRRPPAP